VVAGPHECGDGQEQGGHARGGGYRPDTTLERRQPLLQGGHGRVRDPAVDVALPFQIEQAGRVFHITEHVGGGLIDWDGAGAMVGIGMMAGVHAQRVEVQKLGINQRLSYAENRA